jgi:hypothetical protein
MMGDEQVVIYKLEVEPEIRQHVKRCFPQHHLTREDRASITAFLIEYHDDLTDACFVFECAHFIYHLVNGHTDMAISHRE